MSNYSEWKPRKDVVLKADVFRRSDVDYCPGYLPYEGGAEILESLPIDMILAFFEPVDRELREQYEEWRWDRIGPDEHDW